MDRSLTRWLVALGVIWFILLGCRTANLIAQAQPTFTRTVTRTVTRTPPRPTFTPVPPTVPLPPAFALSPTLALPPTLAAPVPTRAPTPRIVPTRTPVPRPAAPVPPPPTADLYQGYYYRVLKNTCVSDSNTRAEGTVYNNGVPQNGVTVRIANGNGGDPVIDDFITGMDPSDYKHHDPSLQGKYRLGIAEGQRIDGNWWVFIIDSTGQQISVGAYFKTFDAPGCNKAIIDFAH